ncbi:MULTISPECIES: restriction endonuclease subunit S [Bacillota]|uniref:Restriction endonuclease subunit S n=1 Tax=Companilactobacillus halodurans TaxID=2584183 RepID=A0A5P0ZSG8_9LACO|nr:MULTISPECIES: restriction endonuclease subunit S [Bacillota]MCS6105660.1 restriction endonuclease subunit S [Clostridium botulinum]MQS77025.1 restriction endonuclease subunit S [Companilactobacillus halodurans]
MAKIDDSVKKKVPELRFKGFTDPWVQRNLADLSDGFSYGLNAAAKEYDGVHGYLRITDIDEVSHSFLPEGLTSPDVPEDQLTDYRMDEQSIVYARTGASTGKTYIYRDSDGELYYAGFLIRQKVNKETSAQFVYQNTLTKAWERYVQVMSQRSGQPGINAQEVGRFELAIPERAEQDKIAHLFNSLDNLIAANQRKLDLLKEQKKGYLQKMFPQNGSKFPQLRFAGFADDWEQRKVGELYKVTRGQVLATSKTTPEKVGKNQYPVYSSQTKNDGLMGYYSDYLFDTAITWTTDGANAGTVNFRPGKFYSTNVNGVLLSADGLANKAMAENLNRSAWKWVSHVGNPKLMNNVMSQISVMIPVNLSEQEKISEFLMMIDNTIALHQRKLDLLKEQKKGFLQKMFV